MEAVWSTCVEINFVSLLESWDAFSVLLRLGGGVVNDKSRVEVHLYLRCHGLTHVKIHIVLFLAWGGFGQHMFSYILCIRWHKRGFFNTRWDTLFAHFFSKGLVNACWHILFRSWHGMHFVNPSWDTFWVPAGMVDTRWDAFCVLLAMIWIWSTHDEMHLWAHFFGRGLVNPC